ncbi:MAG: M48 family metallopeptidase [Prevotella sp.]|nr:M48 family metallopeptidase [Bacteroides sp.]MCM1366784.1 M48 family metallopeptidase [Prevotella sp.]MCM1436451.1 M48 family metallopeptidase [Prevotella sp.]
MKRLRAILSVILMSLAMSIGVSDAEAFNWLRAASGATKMVQSMTISDSQIRDYVHQYIVQLDKKSSIAPASSKYTQRLNKLTSGLKQVDGVPLNFKVYITKDVNAFACADGSVRVYSGLMDLMSDDEVLGVIGHEIGHVAHKHTKKAIKQALMTAGLRESLASGSGWVAALSASEFGALGEAIMSSSYSKSQESDADEYGYNFLKKNGKNPWAMAMAFSKLKSLEKSGSKLGNAVNQLFSDHPATDKRIITMEKKARKDGFPIPSGYKPMTSS